MNHLSGETSPYLLQHAGNPVDWYPWGEEALSRARELNRPLLVSVGYAACHWCHVMARESFEDPRVAALMNEAFVCVKVDREERPDIDAVCMDACQALNGSGGWPLNVFMTPSQEPFFAGTYFPPHGRAGMPSWAMVVEAIGQAWRSDPERLAGQAAEIARALAEATELTADGATPLPETVIADSVAALAYGFDDEYGGWGGAPKFPPHSRIELLLAAGTPEPALQTLRGMAAGGIYDQLGGGFHRYTVDATWTVPHFEKMLYDNALLARAYLHGWQVSGEPRLREVCEQTLDFVLRELRGPEGGFCTSLDADSDGGEGRYYVWTPAQVREALLDPELAAGAISYFGVSDGGNFDHGTSVLTARGSAAPPARLETIRAALAAARSRRSRPARDEKRLTGMNALMLTALAEAGAVLGRSDYVEAARVCADFVLQDLRDSEGHLLRSYRDGHAHLAGQLEDYAYLLQALVVLYEATFTERYYLAAVELADDLLARFADPRGGGFFTTAAEQPALAGRRKDSQDAPLPSANGTAALALLRLARLSGAARYTDAAAGALALLGPMAARQPSVFGEVLQALDLYLAPSHEVALVGDNGAGPLARAYRSHLRPHAVLAGCADVSAPGETGPRTVIAGSEAGKETAPGERFPSQLPVKHAGRTTIGETAAAGDGSVVPLLAGRTAIDGLPTAYVCEHFNCKLPVTDVRAFQQQLGDLDA